MSTSTDFYHDFLRVNLKNDGVWSSVDDAIKTRRAIICGQIVRKSSGGNLCYELAEMYPKYRAERLFQIRFSQEISQHILSLSLKEGDCFAVCNAKVDLQQQVCKSKLNPVDVVFVDSLRKRNVIENIYYKRQNSIGWSSISVVCSLANESNSNKCCVNLFRITDLNRAEEIAVCIDKSFTTAANNNLPLTNFEQRSSESHSRLSSPELVTCSMKRYSKKKKPKNNVNNRKGSLKHSASMLHLMDRNMPVKRDIAWYHLTKLKDVTSGDRVNVIVILNDCPKKLSRCASGRFVLTLNVYDDSGINEFFVRLIRPTRKDFPVLRPFNIMLFLRMKVSGEKCGSVCSEKSVVVFDKNDPHRVFAEPIVLKNAVPIPILERVDEIRRWMFKTKPNSRPFTSFGSFKLEDDILNLRCRVVVAKEYSSATTMILRVKDGTISRVAVILYDLNSDSWSQCYDRTTVVEKSDEVDILVQKVQSTFVDEVKSVKTNGFIELFGVSACTKNSKFKTNIQHYLELSLVGDYKNLRVEHNENRKVESRYQEQMEIDQPSTSTAQSSYNLSPSNKPERRRLLREDDVVCNSSNFDDSDEDIEIIKTQRHNNQHNKAPVPSLVPKPFTETTENNSLSKSSSDVLEEISNILHLDCEPSTSNNLIVGTEKTAKRKRSNYLVSDDEPEDIENRLDVNVIMETDVCNGTSNTLTSSEVDGLSSVSSDEYKTNKVDRIEQETIVSTSENLNAGQVTESSNKEVTISRNNEIYISVENQIKEVSSESVMHLIDKEKKDGRESPKHVSPISESISVENECPPEFDTLDEDLNLTDTPLGNDIVDEWPDKVKDDQPFRIRAQLKQIKPDIDSSSDDKNLLRLIYTFCENCYYHPMNSSFVEWVTNGTAREPLCRTCHKDEKEVILEFIFICDLILEDAKGNRQSVMAYSPFANKILGCDLENFHLKSTRDQMKNRCHQLIAKEINLIVSVERRWFETKDLHKYFLK